MASARASPVELVIKDFLDISHRQALPIDPNNREVRFTEYSAKSISVIMFRLPSKRKWRNGQIILNITDDTGFVPSFTLVNSPYRKPEYTKFDHLIIIEGSGILTTYDYHFNLKEQVVSPGNVIIANEYYEYTLQCNQYKDTKSLVFLAITMYDFHSLYTSYQDEPYRAIGSAVVDSLMAMYNLDTREKRDAALRLRDYASYISVDLPIHGRFIKGTKMITIGGRPRTIEYCLLIVVEGTIDLKTFSTDKDNFLMKCTTNDIVKLQLKGGFPVHYVINKGEVDAKLIILTPTNYAEMIYVQ